jgi:hypothetical protein
MFVLPFGQWLCAARRIIAWLSRHCSSLTEHAVKFLPVTARQHATFRILRLPSCSKLQVLTSYMLQISDV